VGVLQVEPLADFFHRLVNGISDFLNVDLAYNIERIVLSHTFLDCLCRGRAGEHIFFSFPCRGEVSCEIRGSDSPAWKNRGRFSR
jgi:hypothetical protein